MSEKLSFRQGQLFHMTPIERLPAIVAAGRLLGDSALAGLDLPGPPIAHSHLKERRMGLDVPVPPGGVIGDYVPFYLAPRSPMLYANHCGNVEGRETTRQSGIVYLVTDTARVAAVGSVVLTNKHPLKHPKFTTDITRIHDSEFIDWDVMFDPWFAATVGDTERPERRQAEVLVHGSVPLTAIIGLASRTPAELNHARACCGSMTDWHFKARADWYF